MSGKTEQAAPQSGGLKRQLKQRHIQMMAMGGTIGTGLFYGSGGAIAIAGPAVLVSYLIGGLFMYFILRMMGEMLAQEPESGAFSHFAYYYWGDFAGFISGWGYWLMYVLAVVAELTVAAIYMDYWFALPHWQVAFVLLAMVTLVNLAAVKLFGELEFWSSGIKVAAILAMIVLGLVLIGIGRGGEQAKIANLWAHGGFAPYGWGGIFMALTVVMFSFVGSELIGVSAAETDEARRILPKAIRQYMVRLLLFYIGATLIILILTPWPNLISEHASPFVLVFDKIGIPAAADILNLVLITAAVSVVNSGTYSNGRMLLGLANQGNAPRSFARLNRSHVPARGIIFSSLCSAIGLGLNYAIPGGAFMRVLAIITTIIATCWAVIIITQMRFRRFHQRERQAGRGKALSFKTPFTPYSNYLCLAFLGALFVMMLLTGFVKNGLLTWFFGLSGPLIHLAVPDVSASVLIFPLWLLAAYLGWRLKTHYAKGRQAAGEKENKEQGI